MNIYTRIVDAVDFDVVDPPLFHHLHHLLRPQLDPLLHLRLEVIPNRLLPTQDLYLHSLPPRPRFPLLFHHSLLALDESTRGIILKQMRPIVFDASRRSRKSDDGEWPLFQLLSKLWKRRTTFSRDIIGGSSMKDRIRCTGCIGSSGG